MFWAVQWQRVPVFIALLPAFFIAFILLLGDRKFRLTRELTTGFCVARGRRHRSGVRDRRRRATLWVTHNHPPGSWSSRRTGPDLPAHHAAVPAVLGACRRSWSTARFISTATVGCSASHHWLAIGLNGLLFGFAHIVVASEVAVIGTVLGGFLFAIRYAWTRSFWAVFIEHTIWGWLIFTIGLGRFFFSGVSNL